MIIDRAWNKNTLNYVVSYIDERGNRKIWNKYMHHWTTYEFDDNGDLTNWDGRRCKKIFKDAREYSPNEFDQLELLYGLEKTDPKLYKDLHAPRSPKAYVFDIETKYTEGQFPYPDKAAFEVTAISLVGPDGSCIVYGSHDLNSDQIQRFHDRYIEFIKNNTYAKNCIDVNNIKVLYQYFDSELDMLKHFFCKVLPNITCLTGWNTYNFDFPYLVNRLINIFGRTPALSMIKTASPTNELNMMQVDDGFGNKFKIPSPKHMLWLDEMQLVKDYDYILRPYENYSLDYVGERAVGANKVKYTEHGLNELLKKDPEKYYFYNAIDSLIVMLIRHRLKCLNSPAAVGSLTLVPLLKAFGQVALTTANIFNEFYLDGKHVVYEKQDNVKIPYEGAYTDCRPGQAKFTVASDYKSLYPCTVISTNLSCENIIDKWSEPDKYGIRRKLQWTDEEIEEFKKDPQYFVSINISVFEKKGKDWHVVLKWSKPNEYGEQQRLEWTKEELDEFRKNPKYLVNEFKTVFKNDKNYVYKRMMKKLLDGRDVYKYTGAEVDAVLLPYIDNLIAQRSKE